MCMHMLVCKNVPPLWTIDVGGTFRCLIAVCYPSLFCLRQLHRNAECCSALFFAFPVCVFFFFLSFSSFLLCGCWIGIYPFLCGWLFRHRYVAVALGLPSARAALPTCGDTLGGAAGLDAQLLWCFLTAAIASRRRRLSRSVSRSHAFISGSVVKNKAFQHIKYPFGKWEWKAISQLRVWL